MALHRLGKTRDVKLAKQGARSEDVFSNMGEAKASQVAVLIKTDVQGSAEALRDALNKLSTDEVAVRIIASGVGGITASDVQLAAASKARIIGFNVSADSGASAAVKETGVVVRTGGRRCVRTARREQRRVRLHRRQGSGTSGGGSRQ